ncbi:MAG: molybdopterin biosynthesis protein [Nitrospiraceae bacterium]|nr:molybdopterin biosynthesis protein [Nitrospiraceae bacterium]
MKQIFLDVLPLEKAAQLLLMRAASAFEGLDRTETVDVASSGSLITAEPVFARYSSPFYHSSAMDGYAVKFADTFSASEAVPLHLTTGKDAFYVDTGDPLPEGFNAVVMIEDVNIVGDCIEIYQPLTPYQNVRTIGEDIVSTEMIAPMHHRIRPVDMGAMLASGCLKVKVQKKPVVTIIPTGTELITPQQAEKGLKAPEIIEYNSVVLSSMVDELGGLSVRNPIVKDDFEEIKNAIYEASLTSDIVIVNAGSGRGSEDFTAAAINELGELLINGVSIKPGKPFIAGMVNNKPVLGIPGYPVSAYITFQLFARPLIYKYLGLTPEDPDQITAIVSRNMASPMGVDEFIRVKVGVVKDKYVATPISRGAGLLMSVVRADAMLRIPADSEGIKAGSEAKIDLINSISKINNTIVCIGSHDNTLDLLANALKVKHPELSLSSAHVGSMGGLMALKRSEAHICGTHLLDEETGQYNVPYVNKFFTPGEVVLVTLVHRQQGLIVKKGNPKGIKGIEDLVRDDLLFINRQQGSGTRLLLDKNLRERNINPYLIKGYDREEYTHMSVASAVLTGLCDTGMAIYSAAVALDLAFIPIATERYDIAITAELLNTEKISALLDIIRNDKSFREAVERMGGYDTSSMGETV